MGDQWSEADFTAYLQSVALLKARKTVIWPDPDDLLITDQKVLTHARLSAIGAALGHKQPDIRVVKPTQVEALARHIVQSGSKDIVMKRSMSFGKKHVVHAKTTDEELDEMLQGEKFWDNAGAFGRPCWFVQPFLPLMETIGEARAYVANGTLCYVVWTDYLPNQKLSWSLVNQMRPLHTYRQVF